MSEHDGQILDAIFLELQKTEEPKSDARDTLRQSYLGPYHLLGELGHGGVARVWRARHVDPNFASEAVAMKLLHAKFSEEKRIVGLFRGEALIMSLLRHPNIVRVVDAGELESRLFIAMEQVGGTDLDELLFQLQEAKQYLPFDVGLYVILSTLRALSFAHGLRGADGRLLQLVHRDVNPANVFVSFEGEVKLGDFGVASITQAHGQKSQEVAGKVGYFAPEQLEGMPSDHRSDLFAVGVMMFEVFCNHRLFEADAKDQAIRRNARAHAPRPTRLNPALPPEIEPIMLQALERRPEDRFEDAQAMLMALMPFVDTALDASIGLRSLLRARFSKNFLKVTDEHQRLTGQTLPSLQGFTLDFIATDERARSAIAQLLGQNWATVRTHADTQSLAASSSLGAGHLLLVDLTDPARAQEGARRVAESAGKKVPIVCLGAQYDRITLLRATQLAAVELLVRPMRPERLVDACRRALLAQPALPDTTPKPTGVVPTSFEELRGPSCGLVVSRDPGLLARAQSALSALNAPYRVVSDAQKALELGLQVSHTFLIVDTHAAPAHFRDLIAAYRKLPGIKQLPVLLLIDEVQRPLLRSLAKEGLVLANRLLPLGTACEDILSAKTRDEGEIFTLYKTPRAGRIRVRGRSEPCSIEKISRGGVIGTTSVMPPLGSFVEVTVSGVSRSEVCFLGQVARVALMGNEASAQHARLGITCLSFADKQEHAWIMLLQNLEHEANPEEVFVSEQKDF